MTRHRPGFTLIETLLYTLFVGMLMTSMTLLAYTAFSIRDKLRASLIVEENVRFSLGRIASLVSEASDVSVPTVGSTSGTLILSMPSVANSPTTIALTDGTVFLTQTTGTTVALTSNEVSFSTLSFTRVSSTSAIIRIVATGGMRNATSAYATFTVTTTAAVRR